MEKPKFFVSLKELKILIADVMSPPIENWDYDELDKLHELVDYYIDEVFCKFYGPNWEKDNLVSKLEHEAMYLFIRD